MRKQQPPPSFAAYLKRAIEQRGFKTPTEFARAASIHPSVVLKWLSNETRPAVPLLERAAPVLGTKVSTLVRLAYPETNDDGQDVDDGARLHPLAAELDRRLGDKSSLSEIEKDTLARIVDSVLAQHRARPSTRKAPS